MSFMKRPLFSVTRIAKRVEVVWFKFLEGNKWDAVGREVVGHLFRSTLRAFTVGPWRLSFRG